MIKLEKTGTYRSPVYCKICKKEYLDICSKHPNDWEIKNDWIKKDDALEYVLENYYDEVREAVFEQEAESRQE